MRRRDSKDTLRPFKALLDAFFRSVSSGDRSLAEAIYRAIQAIDTTGKLSAIAFKYLQDPGPGQLPPLDQNDQLARELFSEYEVSLLGGSLDILSPGTDNAQASSPGVYCTRCTSEITSHERQQASLQAQSNIELEKDPASHEFKLLDSFNQVVTFCQQVERSSTELSYRSKFHHHLDPFNTEAHDPASRAILSYRDLARHNIQSGASALQVIGTAQPAMAVIFGSNTDAQFESVWSWACRFVRTFPGMQTSLQMSKIYMLALQMRVRLANQLDAPLTLDSS